MAQIRKYATAKAFRTALEERLMQIAKKENTDIQRLRKQVAFDRLLARLFQGNTSWVLKGGYAMELRVKSARATKDIDLAMRDEKLTSKKPEERNLILLGLLQEHASQSLDDHFEFTIGMPTLELDAAPEGGARFPVEAKMDGRSFTKFQLDIGIGDVWIEPLDELNTRDWLKFAGVEASAFPAISKEQQFAEKLHAYSLPRVEGITNSRVKDLVDMVLLITEYSLDMKRLIDAVKATFDQRDTHPIPKQLSAPPANWTKPYAALATECGLKSEIGPAYEQIGAFFSKLDL